MHVFGVRMQLKTNIAANFLGKLLQAIVLLIFIPVYARLLGAEAFGLIGFFTSLLAVFAILDGGLSLAAAREAARAYSVPADRNAAWGVIGSIEKVYWIVAVAMGALLVISSGYIAESWLKRGQLAAEDVRIAVIMMSIALSIRWPVSVYSGVLLGSNRQVLVNIVNLIITVLKSLGAVLILIFVSRSIIAYFVWQTIACIVETAAFYVCFRSLKTKNNVSSSLKTSGISKVFQFSAGISVLNILVMIINQTDKLVISKYLPLEMLGYYSLAVTLTGAMFMVSSSVTTATFPRFTGFFANDNRLGAAALYHTVTEHLAVTLAGIAAVFIFFPVEVLLIWTKRPEIAAQGSVSLSLLGFGMMLNGIVQVVNLLQLAAGKTRTLINFYSIAALVAVPCSLLFIPRYGIAGGGIACVVVNLLLYFSAPYLANHITGEQAVRMFFYRTGRPIIVSMTIFGSTKLLSCIATDPHPYVFPLIATLFYGGFVVLGTNTLLFLKQSRFSA